MTNYPLRLPDHVMAEARALAARSGTSLNQFLSTLIAERVGEMKALAHIEARAGRADIDAALAVLAQVPERAPLQGDERSN
ncbi:MAG: pilus assembly protein HicB [Sphingomonadaceae bacterium]|nr:pilus assembly protein HicB [Sphingomonadaceae bacterium]